MHFAALFLVVVRSQLAHVCFFCEVHGIDMEKTVIFNGMAGCGKSELLRALGASHACIAPFATRQLCCFACVCQAG